MKKYILTIDAGTTGVTVLVIDKNLNIITKYYKELNQYHPNVGWVEHDPCELINKINSILDRIKKTISFNDIISIGITNQRESVILWDKLTGKPVYNMIVWQCSRTKDYCKKLNKDYKDIIFSKTGLYIDSYFSATKINWLLNQKPALIDIKNISNFIVGTVDSWIIWNLTNEKNHFTDFTNASRTMIYNINTKEWDKDLLEIFNIPKSLLPSVKNSADYYGTLKNTEIPINAVAGDQQAALYGHGAYDINTSKCTYGTGLFFLLNTGKKRIDSNNGLITTLACNEYGKPVYAMEGSVFVGGFIVQWLRDKLELIENASQTEKISLSVKNTKGVYVVPAFSGLGAPHWNSECSGIITGLTAGVDKRHIIRSCLESIAFQVEDLLSSIRKDIGESIDVLNVDGGATENNFLMQFQSDISKIKILKPKNIEITSLGVAIMAGVKINLWKDAKEALKYNEIDSKFIPSMSSRDKNNKLRGWKKALRQL